ncbi:filamentous hemagglutinin N-terminal domain-containing protein [Nostoc parmelioides]|uniref:S-layer family protein n=1 Tax=Nostoc parmelioides FACHB-3921 TaxID=2692909 RepID=A0ABR8BJL7_9NOSO|nr:S-layer family protein [Nostoc parmelioides]MBD2254073.1 S-layer family protein [Nostoc parmelioides FACHB-3921]
MYPTTTRHTIRLAILVIGSVIFTESYVLAEIKTDTTLGRETSRLNQGVRVKGAMGDIIDGGAVRGTNLFHSFQEFTIGEGQRVYFSNPGGIENILTRVAGNNRSDILGTLGVLGNANLFLLNPKGIVLGKNARLDIAGSFVASTADSVVFSNGFTFSAGNPQAPPLLNINVPLGLQYHGNQADIQVQGTSIFNANGKTIALVGGNVSLNESSLRVPAGRVELGGVLGEGTVEFQDNSGNLSLSFPENLAKADILLNGTIINVIAGNGGSVAINARNIDMISDSIIFAGIGTGLGSTNSRAGNITLNAVEEIKIDGISAILQYLFPRAVGKTGDINITAKSVVATNGAAINSVTLGNGDAGNITITARDRILLDGEGIDGFATAVGNSIVRGAVGKIGNVNITTRVLTLTKGASVVNQVSGQGNAGNIVISARDIVSLDGEDSSGSSSSISSQVTRGAFGNGGNIDITTGSLVVTNGGQISTNLFGRGNAGNVMITADDTASFAGTGSRAPSGVSSGVADVGVGKAGNINITSKFLSLTNQAEFNSRTDGKADAGQINLRVSDRLTISDNSGILANTSTSATGNSGSIFIDTNKMIMQNRARVIVNNRSTGTGGNIDIQASTLTLDTGAIVAETNSNTGGDIRLQLEDLLLLRRNSLISTTAGTTQAGGNGGNINISTPLMITAPLENNDIIANAFSGSGGVINITTQSILGFTSRTRADLEALLATKDPSQLNPRSLPTSDITAISQANPSLDGRVTIDTPDVDPDSGLVALPTNVVDASRLIAQTCRSGGEATASQQSEFVITGRGGLPPKPGDSLSSDAIWQDLQSYPSLNEKAGEQEAREQGETSPTPILEAQGWVTSTDGKITLVAQASTTTPHNSSLTPVSCS